MESISKTDVLLKQLSALVMSANYSDVTFVVDGEKIPAHRVIFAARSEYFRALLFGGLAESHQREITLDVPLEPFKIILNYIYTGMIGEDELNDDNLFEVFDLAHQYGFTELDLAIANILKKTLSVETALQNRQKCAKYEKSELLAACDRFVDENAEQILQQKESFHTLTEEDLKAILQRDSFCVKEIDIFLAVKDWCEQHPDANVKAVMSNVRFSLIDEDFLLNKVRPTGLVDSNVLLDAIQVQRNITYSR